MTVRTSMTDPSRVVSGAIDTHRDVHVAAVIDSVRALLGMKSFPTTPLGMEGLERWLTWHG